MKIVNFLVLSSSVAIKMETYLQLINDEIIPQLIEIIANQFYFDNGSFQGLWWIQDGAPAHRLREVNNVLLGCFQY